MMYLNVLNLIFAIIALRINTNSPRHLYTCDRSQPNLMQGVIIIKMFSSIFKVLDSSFNEAFIVLYSIGISITNRWLEVERYDENILRKRGIYDGFVSIKL